MMRYLLTIILMLQSMAMIAQNSAYINKVYEYRPAPGQFINVLPEYEDGDTEETMRQKAEDCIANHNNTMICLGSFGGYVVFGFDHRITNEVGRYDFTVQGNAFYAAANPNKTETRQGGSSEPGIVMVSRDDNGNGLPDDAWYELAGSEYYNKTTKKNFTLTYHRPDASHVATPDNDNKTLIDTTFVAWEASDGGAGHVYKNSYHKQNYYPEWIEADKYSLSGTSLPNNAVDESGKGTYYVLYCYGYGYVDNHPNADARSKFNIEWAVDGQGRSVQLDGIDFVRVHTAVNQQAGWLGETSTEVADAWDLHMTGGDDEDEYWSRDKQTGVERHTTVLDREIYDITGRKVSSITGRGVYIIRENGKTRKVIIK